MLSESVTAVSCRGAVVNALEVSPGHKHVNTSRQLLLIKMSARVLSGSTDDWPIFSQPLGTALVSRLQQHRNRVLQVYPVEGHEATAQWILDAAASEAARLEAGPGDVVAVCCTFSPHIAPVLLAAVCAGAAYAPVNYNQSPEELSAVLEKLSPRVLYCDAVAVDAVRKAWPHREPLVLGTAPPATHRLQPTDPLDLKELEGVPVAYMSTSGTTGSPKQAIFTQASVSAMLHAVGRKDWVIREDDVMISTSGAFWISGFSFLLWSLYIGFKLVVTSKFEESNFLDLVEKYKVTVMFIPSNQHVALVKHPEEGKAVKLRSCRLCVGAGISMSAATERQVASSLGVSLQQWYGMTEAFPLVGGWLCPSPQPVGSVGRMAPYQQLKVVDMNDGSLLPPGVDGELWIRGPYVSPGYLHTSPRESGWFFTGDVGHYDENEFLFIVDRIKQIIKFRGFHVAPAEIETVLLEHPDVLEAVVLGKPHPTDQEHPTAFVVLRPGKSVLAETLKNFVAERISNTIKHLKGGVYFVESLPKAATGKVKRSELHSQLEQQLRHSSEPSRNIDVSQ